MTPAVRQTIYTIAAVAAGVIPLLVTYKILDPAAGTAWTNLVGILGAIGSGGAATAAVVLSKQRKDQTLDFHGTAAEQAIQAIQATVAQAGTAAADLDKVRQAAVEAVSSGVTDAIVTACGDALK